MNTNTIEYKDQIQDFITQLSQDAIQFKLDIDRDIIITTASAVIFNYVIDLINDTDLFHVTYEDTIAVNY